MSKSMDRFRASHKYTQRGLDMLYGDGLEYLPLATSALAEITQKAVEAKTAAEKKKQIEAAQQDVVDAQSAVAQADLKEKDASGPMHIAAKQQLIKAQAILAKLVPGVMPSGSMPDKGKGGGAKAAPWYTSPYVIVGGIGAVGLIGYLIFRKRGKR